MFGFENIVPFKRKEEKEPQYSTEGIEVEELPIEEEIVLESKLEEPEEEKEE